MQQWQTPPPDAERGGGVGPAFAIVAAVVAVILLFAAVLAGTVLWMRLRTTSRPIAVTPVIVTPTPSGPTWSDIDSPVPVTASDPMRGDRDALVTIVVFSDYQCPYCAKLETTLDSVRTSYASSEVRILWKNSPLPFHPQAKPAAVAAQGVFEVGGNTAFWEFHDQVFANQASMNQASYEAWASATAIDMTKWNRGMSAGDYTVKVDEDTTLGKTLGVSGTPTSFINGTILVGAQPLASLKTAIDRELVSATSKLSTGVARDRIYVTMSKENFSMPTPYGSKLPSATGVTTTDLKIGTGAMAIAGDNLTVHYTGSLDNGTVFDSSIKAGTPFSFQLGAGHVIKGWDKGLAGMRVGGKRKLVIEPEQAYGTKGAPPSIPPNARLTFEVELLSIK